ncbi:MAG: choice-of-anchor tandem repeat GloVer-containing protein, partial [Terriglobales bacterium]
IRGAVCSFTVVSLLALSLAALGGLAGAQTRDIKRVGGSGGLAASGAGGHRGNGEGPHPAFLADDVLYNFCGDRFSLSMWNGYLCVDENPVAGLFADLSGNGNLYGTDLGPGNSYLRAEYEDLYPTGSVFMVNSAGQTTTLHQFQPGEDGQWPVGGVVQDSAGNLYGTTEFGATFGTANNSGIVYEIEAPIQMGATYKILYQFQGGTLDGANPVASLALDTQGNIYGTTEYGGTHNAGTVFMLCAPGSTFPYPCSGASGWQEHLLYSFGNYQQDGMYPAAGLSLGSTIGTPVFYGTTVGGGNSDPSCTDPSGGNTCGTLFTITSPFSGAWYETVLWDFQGGTGDGENPVAGLLLQAGNSNGPDLYGTTENGGSTGTGAVFELQPPTYVGNPWSEAWRYSFQGGTDGANPTAGLIFDGTHFYSTTQNGGTTGSGTAFEIAAAASTDTVLYNFCSAANCTDGYSPLGGLVEEASFGRLYGTTFSGGSGSIGTVFELYTPCRFCGIVYPYSLNWQTGFVGKISGVKYVKLTNQGSQTMDISSIEVSGEFAFAKAKKGGCTGTLAAGATCVIGATFDPTQTGLLTGQITITDNADNSPQTVALSGTGVE